jgi:hypothetical protein
MSGRTGDDDRQSNEDSTGSGREDPPFYDEAPPQQVGSGDGDSGQPQQRAGVTGQPDGGTTYPGQQGGSSALDQELNRDDDGRDNGDELGENR